MPQEIHDGQTLGAFFKAIPKAYPDVRFRFRPATLAERYEWSNKVQDLEAKPLEKASYVAKFVAARLKKWDLKDHLGRAVTANSVHLQNPVVVHPQLLLRLTNVILGMEVWDDDPQADEADRKERDEVEAEAAATGKAPGDVAEDREAKN